MADTTPGPNLGWGRDLSSEPEQELSDSLNGPQALQLAEAYSRHHRFHRAGGEFVFVPERVPLLVAEVGGPGLEVLDLGCRTGAVSELFLPGNRVVGVDIDREALAVAAGRGVEPLWANVEAPLPFDDGVFDVVVAGELLEHLRSPAEVVSEVRRVLRPGGAFVGSVPNAYRLQDRWAFLRGRPPDADPTHLRMYSPASLVELLDGFENVWLRFVGGRGRLLNPRLFARDIVFRGAIPAASPKGYANALLEQPHQELRV